MIKKNIKNGLLVLLLLLGGSFSFGMDNSEFDDTLSAEQGLATNVGAYGNNAAGEEQAPDLDLAPLKDLPLLADNYDDTFFSKNQTAGAWSASTIFWADQQAYDKQQDVEKLSDSLVGEVRGKKRKRNQAGKVACSNCKKFFGANYIAKHEQIHKKAKPLYQCGQCVLGFFRKRDLTKHMQMHRKTVSFVENVFADPCDESGGEKNTNKKRYACEVCRKDCKKPSALKIHMRIHIGEKPFRCTVCKQQCSQKGNLKMHYQRLHPNDPIPCDEPDEGKRVSEERGLPCLVSPALPGPFKIVCLDCKSHGSEKCLVALETHIVKHTKERPHVCGTCSKAFNTKGNLNKHIRTQHKGQNEHASKIARESTREVTVIRAYA